MGALPTHPQPRDIPPKDQRVVPSVHDQPNIAVGRVLFEPRNLEHLVSCDLNLFDTAQTSKFLRQVRVDRGRLKMLEGVKESGGGHNSERTCGIMRIAKLSRSIFCAAVCGTYMTVMPTVVRRGAKTV
jgi:hypothetical protein